MSTTRVRMYSKGSPNSHSEQSTAMPACDECRNRKIKCNRELPTCSNCSRAGIVCEFPVKDKKTSQAKQIANDMATFNDRLSALEHNLTRRIEDLTGIISQSVQMQSGQQSPARRSSSSTRYGSHIDLSGPSSEDTRPGRLGRVNKAEDCGVTIENGSAKRFYGDTSTYKYFCQSRGLVKQLLEGQSFGGTDLATPGQKACLAEIHQLYDAYAMPGYYQEDPLVNDGLPLEIPPRELLEASIDFYLNNPSIEPILFDGENLRAAVNAQYSKGGSPPDEAWILCFSCIILRSMDWVSKFVRNSHPLINGMNEQVCTSLVGNVNRGLAKTERLGNLRMVNIQTLLLLAFVARDYIHFNIFERLFDGACQIAEQMGLCQLPNFENPSSIHEIERRNLVWFLYLVDKERVFIRGTPCRLYIFDFNVELPAQRDGSLSHRPLRAHLELATLQEEIYKHLYSPKAKGLSRSVRLEHVRRLESRVEAWSVQYHSELEIQGGASREKAVLLQLRYAWHIARLLIAEHGEEGNEQLRFEIGRSALQVIQILCNGAYIFNGGLLVLERIFCDYSTIAFHKVFAQILRQPQTTDANDLSLLSTTASALKLLSHPSRADSYCTRLHRNLDWCTRIAQILQRSRTLQRESMLVPLLPKANSTASSLSSVEQVAGHKLQNTAPGRICNSFDANMHDSPSTEESSISSNDLAAAQQIPTTAPMDGMINYGMLPNSASLQQDDLTNLNFVDDAWMQSYMGTQNLDMVGTELDNQQMPDFMADSFVAMPSAGTTKNGAQYNPLRQDYIFNF